MTISKKTSAAPIHEPFAITHFESLNYSLNYTFFL